MMGVFCDMLKLCSTAALDCWTGHNKGRYHLQKRALIHTRLISMSNSRCGFKLLSKQGHF